MTAWTKLTLQLVLQRLDLRVRVVYELVHLLAQRVVLLRQPLRKVLLVDDLLRSLVAVKCQTTTGTLHYDRGAQPTEHAGLVILGRIQSSGCNIIWVVK